MIVARFTNRIDGWSHRRFFRPAVYPIIWISDSIMEWRFRRMDRRNGR